MSRSFSIQPFRDLVEIILNHIDNKHSYFNIPQDIFFRAGSGDPYKMIRSGQMLETPIGTAAGPHTQFTQNIIASWLCGARYIELKTIQTLDEIKISKPCIDMQDEGYNCEWSQELSIPQSFDQYLNAWILVHILKDKLGHSQGQPPGTIFNMSIGYDMKGILQENVQWFLDCMNDSHNQKNSRLTEIMDIYPRAKKLSIPDCISDNVTLSTMHGCPPEEIEKICKYLIEERKLNTILKLNPTLLGKEKLNEILQQSGFGITVPDEAFNHDLTYKEAIKIIRNLQKTAAINNVHFGLKLTNTLESNNISNTLPSHEKIIYMSGRALHPIAINLALRLQCDFHGKLDISFSAGANAYNIHKVLSCGLKPVTVCSDLLKPGGYGLLNQYLTNLSEVVKNSGAATLNEFILKISGKKNVTEGGLENLKKYAAEVLTIKDYKQNHYQRPDIKIPRELTTFDCIVAPCEETCPAGQAIPDYLFYTSIGEINNAFRSILLTNPFPNTTGMVCDHLCQPKCTRINYDDPLLIREIKRFVAENYAEKKLPEVEGTNDKNVAVIGAGPSGLACAFYLRCAGFNVDVFETKNTAGGMVDEAIPEFRLKKDSLLKDIERIENCGVKMNYAHRIDRNRFEHIRNDYDYILIATGAWTSRKFSIEGIDNCGVLDPVEFLGNVKRGITTGIGKNIAVIGGGNTAADAARTAIRLAGKDAKVTIIYRRSIALMPADPDEINALIKEGISIRELTLPIRVNAANGRIMSLNCVRIKLEKKQGSFGLVPVEIQGSEFEFQCDTVIPAIGQDADFDFIEKTEVHGGKNNYETVFPNVFISGDAKRGGSTIIQAVADGRKIAGMILERAGYKLKYSKLPRREQVNYDQLMLMRMKKQKAVNIPELNIKNRNNFRLVTKTLPKDKAMIEASRCLKCDELCNICVTVCPNLACFSFRIEPFRFQLQKIILNNGDLQVVLDRTFEVKQPYQILHIADWCNECGNCSTFCPSKGVPYKDKPHLFINEDSFNKSERGYFYNYKTQELLQKEYNRKYSLLKKDDFYLYYDDRTEVVFEINSFRIVQYKFIDQQVTTFATAAEMSVILAGANEFWKGKNK